MVVVVDAARRSPGRGRLRTLWCSRRSHPQFVPLSETGNGMIVQSVAQEADARLLPAPQQCLQAEFEVGQCLPLIRLVLEIDQVAGLLLMDPDDPGHGGIIKPPRPGQAELQQLQLVPGDGDALPDRSEERRVGKECRSRWSP